MTIDLFARLPVYTPPASIDLRCCGVEEMLAEVRGVRLIVADPPWRYSENPGGANPELNGIYTGLSDAGIAAHLDLSYDCAATAGARLAVWYTWPKSAEWRAAGMAGPRWGGETSGGAWIKHDHVGVGYHWRGWSEPVALFTRGACGRSRTMLGNGHVSTPTDHSEKPIGWLREWVRAWTDPDDLVVDMYAGMAPVARACAAEGRRYVGAEIDPERHSAALARLAAYIGALP